MKGEFMIPRFGLPLVLCVVATANFVTAAEPLAPKVENDIAWYDAKAIGIEGQGWTDTKLPYDRFPGKAEETVRKDVWNLSRNSAGMAFRFVTASPTIQARWTVTSDRLAMPHMAATGVSGLDLYAKDDAGRWRWVACGFPKEKTNTVILTNGIQSGPREYMIYLPLYNGVSQVEVGVPMAQTLERAPEYAAAKAKPIVFYGTSITHGACASRPGMVHTAILGRRYQRPVINLGFSGNGRMESAVGALLTELDPAVYVIDCCPNLGPADTAKNTEPLVQQLRAARPDVPIILVEDRRYTDAWLNTGKGKHNDGNHAALKAAFDKLITAGDKHLYYIPGDDLLGDDNEGAVDSSHPNDLGFQRQAEAFAKVMDALMK